MDVLTTFVVTREQRKVPLSAAFSVRVRDDTRGDGRDRKSTRLNSSHLVISYAVFCLKKKTHRSSFSSYRRPVPSCSSPNGPTTAIARSPHHPVCAAPSANTCCPSPRSCSSSTTFPRP